MCMEACILGGLVGNVKIIYNVYVTVFAMKDDVFVTVSESTPGQFGHFWHLISFQVQGSSSFAFQYFCSYRGNHYWTDSCGNYQRQFITMWVFFLLESHTRIGVL